MRNFKNKHEEGTKSNASLHQGHRNRLRVEFRKNKLSEVDDYKMMEYCLHICLPRKDTNPLAHHLINEFGSFAGVCDTEENVLRTRGGVTENMAHFLHHLPNVLRNYKFSKQQPKPILLTPQDIFNFLGEPICTMPTEEFYVVLLDSASRVIAKRMISFGGVNEVNIKAQEILKFAINFNASKVIMVHNHPTGSEQPSIEDIETTKRIFVMLTASGIELDDHMIVNSMGYYFSFAREGLLQRFENDYNKMIR